MTVLNSLASSLGEKGSGANIALAKEIASTENHQAIKELVENLNNKDKKIQSDCIKVLYETGYIKPMLIAGYYTDFMALLTHKNNRLAWGAMIVIYSITYLKPQEVFASLDLIMETVEKGSVITIDCGIEILSRLSTFPEYVDKAEPLLTEQLWKCPIKQFPMYIEKSLVAVNSGNKAVFLDIIEKRKKECEKESQKKRLDKVLKKIS